VAEEADLEPVAEEAELSPVAEEAELSPVAEEAELSSSAWLEEVSLYSRLNMNLTAAPMKSWSDSRKPIFIFVEATLLSSSCLLICPGPSTSWNTLSPGA
jgi:hypothetical protein